MLQPFLRLTNSKTKPKRYKQTSNYSGDERAQWPPSYSRMKEISRQVIIDSFNVGVHEKQGR